MNYLYAALLGLIQGLTEFLPVSSSGHLAIAQHFLPGFEQPGLLFDVLLHAATTLAVVTLSGSYSPATSSRVIPHTTAATSCAC